MGVPQNHQFRHGFSIINHPFCGTTTLIYRNLQIGRRERSSTNSSGPTYDWNGGCLNMSQPPNWLSSSTWFYLYIHVLYTLDVIECYWFLSICFHGMSAVQPVPAAACFLLWFIATILTKQQPTTNRHSRCFAKQVRGAHGTENPWVFDQPFI